MPPWVRLGAFAFLSLAILSAQRVGPVPVSSVPSSYSEEALAAGLEGTVLIEGVIASDGRLTGAKVTRSMGLGLDERALDSVSAWRFKPIPEFGQLLPVPQTVNVDFVLPERHSRWHLIRVMFLTPEGVNRPRFVRTEYPPGLGVTPRAAESIELLIGIRRPFASVTISFVVDETGMPGQFSNGPTTDLVWASEAIEVIRSWQFNPATKDGLAVPAGVTVRLVWGSPTLSSALMSMLGDHPYAGSRARR